MSTLLDTALTIYRRRDLEQLRQFWADFHLVHYGKDLKGTGTKLPSYVNDGRWVADCPMCNAGIACHPDISQGCCLECGIVYQITFPPLSLRQAAEEQLMVRPKGNRNWFPDEANARRHGLEGAEKVDQLKAENALLLDEALVLELVHLDPGGVI